MDALLVSRIERLPDAPCLIEIDDYVPLRFRTSDAALGVKYLRLGNYRTTLVELKIDPVAGVLRGLTVTSFTLLSPWPLVAISVSTEGLPVLFPSWSEANRIDISRDFHVAVGSQEILLYWSDLSQCEASCFSARVQFLMVGGCLAGVLFSDLSADQLRTFAAHARGVP